MSIEEEMGGGGYMKTKHTMTSQGVGGSTQSQDAKF